MRILGFLLIIGLLAAAVAALFFRLAPMPASVWHVDPATVTPPASPNYALRQGSEAVRLAAPAATVAQRLQNIAATEGASLIAGNLMEGGHATYVVRSALMGYPDAVSIRLTPEGEGTVMQIFSRARFGHSDMGVNDARVARWIAAAAP